MFDIGWQELLVIAAVAIVVVGPKDLPRLLRMAGKYVAKVKRMADDFKEQIDDAVRDSELKELKSSVEKEVEGLKNMDLVNDIQETVDDIDKREREEKARAEAERLALEEDQNLDWDEPDEVIEKDAEGKIIAREKKSIASDEQGNAEEKAPGVQEVQGQTAGDVPQEKAAAAAVAERPDDEDDEGDLLDEEEYAAGAATSGAMIEQARIDLEKRIQNEIKSVGDEDALSVSKTGDDAMPSKETSGEKEDGASPVKNGNGHGNGTEREKHASKASSGKAASKTVKSENTDTSANEQLLP